MCSYGNRASTLLNLPRDECKRILRRLELEAYCSTVSALRAQGDLTNEKKLLLQSLQECLKISAERHGAEVRRAVNDQKLTTIANNLSGPDVSSRWMREGRRLVPVMPRLVPHTAFTATANSTAVLQAERNKTLQDSTGPSSASDDHLQYIRQTSQERLSSTLVGDHPGCLIGPENVFVPRFHNSCKVPSCNVGVDEAKVYSSAHAYISSNVEPVVAHTGSTVTGQLLDVPVNGVLDPGVTMMETIEGDCVPAKRKRDGAVDSSFSLNNSAVSAGAAIVTSTCQPSFHRNVGGGIQQTMAVCNIQSKPPIKLTMAKPLSRLTSPKQGGPPQKVIIVSGTGVSSATTICAPPQTIFPQKSVVVSVMKTSTPVPLPTVVTSFTMNSVMTSSTADETVSNSCASGVGVVGTQVIRSSVAQLSSVNFVQNASTISNSSHPNTMLRPRLKGLAARPRTPQMLQASSLNHGGFNASGMQSVSSASPSTLNVKPVPLKATIQIRPDGTKKIITTKPVNVSSITTKILPKPVTLPSVITVSSAAPAASATASTVPSNVVTSVSVVSNQGSSGSSVKVSAGSLIQGTLGSRLVFGEGGSVGQNLIVVQKLPSSISQSTSCGSMTSVAPLSNSADKNSDMNLDFAKIKPTLVINRIPLEKNDGKLACATVPSLGCGMQSVASRPMGNQPCESRTPLQQQPCRLDLGIQSPTDSNPLEQNDAEDLSAITALLSLKMLPTGVEQISPNSEDPADDCDGAKSSELEEKKSSVHGFSISQQPVIERTTESINTMTADCKELPSESKCLHTSGQTETAVAMNGPERDSTFPTGLEVLVFGSSTAKASDSLPTQSEVQMPKEPGEGPLDLRMEPDIHCNSLPVTTTHTTTPTTAYGHTNHCDSEQIDAIQSSCAEVSKLLYSSEADGHFMSSTDADSSVSPNKLTEPLSPTTLGKRKRRPPRSSDELDQLPSGWCRQALALLTRVMKYRSPYNEKGKANAASWFIFPVDASEVPDYYDIVDQPMDFSTIKQNLKSGVYEDWAGFHSDMLLVRDNCHLYNAADTDVRHDCDLVFEFYQQEYSKAVTFWKQQQQHLSNNSILPSGRRPKGDHGSTSDHAVH